MTDAELQEVEIKAPMPYVYNAMAVRAYDGDTLTVDIDLGFSTHHRITLRLARIDTPELRGEEREMGLAARGFVHEKLFGKSGLMVKPLIVQTYKDKTEKYGRYLADVFVDGVCLNDELVKAGHAVYKDY